MTFDLWRSGEVVDSVQLADGDHLHVGMAVWKAECGMNAGGQLVISRVIWYEIERIETTSTPGRAKATCLRRGTDNERIQFEGNTWVDVTPEVGAPWTVFEGQVR